MSKKKKPPTLSDLINEARKRREQFSPNLHDFGWNIPEPGSYSSTWVNDTESAYWVQKGQELKKYNYETEQMEYWIAQKDIPSTIDRYWDWCKKKKAYLERKQITAQANFELLNL